MYEYQTTFTKNSEVCRDVRIVLHRFTDARRREMRLATAEVNAEMRRISAETVYAQTAADVLVEESRERRLTSAEALELAKASIAIADLDMALRYALRDRVEPDWIQWGVAAIEGLSINGQPATLNDVAAGKGPPELYREIISFVQAELGLSEDQQKNLLSPTTLQPPVGGESKPMTAAIAGAPTSDSIPDEIAADTSLKM